MRVLKDHSAVEMSVLGNSEPLGASISFNAAGATSSSIETAASTSDAVEATPSSTLAEASVSSHATRGTVTARATQISDLRPRVLSRLSGAHRACCFYGYEWCCHALGCVKYSQCGHDIRAHFRKVHREQAASFDFAKLVHRAEQEAKAWAEGEDMDVDEYAENEA